MRFSAALAALLLAAPAAAQLGDPAQPGLNDPLRELELLEALEEVPAAPLVELEPRQKMTFGEDGYLSGETDVFFMLPLDFSADLNYSFYKSDFSSAAHTVAFSGGKEWDSKFVGVTYTITPWANDYRADSFGVKLSMRSGPRDWRTTLGADVLVTHHTQLVRINAGTNPTLRFDVTQRTPTISVRQQLKKTRLSIDVSESTYNKDIPIASLNLALATLRYPTIATNFGGASGLVQGFQDWSARFGASQDFELADIPLSLWASYQNIHLMDTFQSPSDVSLVYVRGQTVDSLTFGLDAEITRLLSGTLQYNRVRQTNFETRNYYGFSLGLRL